MGPLATSCLASDPISPIPFTTTPPCHIHILAAAILSDRHVRFHRHSPLLSHHTPFTHRPIGPSHEPHRHITFLPASSWRETGRAKGRWHYMYTRSRPSELIPFTEWPTSKCYQMKILRRAERRLEHPANRPSFNECGPGPLPAWRSSCWPL